jgi:hypothetical protein
MGAIMSYSVLQRLFFCVWLFLFKKYGFILSIIEPAKASRASVSSNWRVFCFMGAL